MKRKHLLIGRFVIVLSLIIVWRISAGRRNSPQTIEVIAEETQGKVKGAITPSGETLDEQQKDSVNTNNENDLPKEIDTPPAVNCESVEKDLISKTSNFMKVHMERNPTKILSLISAPTNMDEISEYDFLLGKDMDNEIRLYKTAQFSYTTLSYKVGRLTSMGDHQQERGTLACDISVREERSRSPNEDGALFVEESMIRHLVFSVSESGTIKLTDFTSEKASGKYSGFY